MEIKETDQIRYLDIEIGNLLRWDIINFVYIFTIFLQLICEIPCIICKEI